MELLSFHLEFSCKNMAPEIKHISNKVHPNFRLRQQLDNSDS